ncbi:hypothetical protein D1BOALGB6SA_10148 [Olavius sp. associated proteobacterium Delta 1]|nr:hypothetical protein D1BOALGB6SA_10148 [Olavius sp. associated proteobacterium Delta 1]
MCHSYKKQENTEFQIVNYSSRNTENFKLTIIVIFFALNCQLLDFKP